jgi:dolichol kinase
MSAPLSADDAAFRRELRRKAFHQAIFLYLGAYFLIGYPRIVWAMAAWCAFVAIVETLRLKVPASKQLFMRFFGGIIREKENRRLSGAFYVTLGLFATMACFGDRPRVVTAGLLFLTLGDAVSPLVGMRVGWVPFDVMGVRRSVAGVGAGFLVTLGIGLALGFPLLASVIAAAVFSVIDTVPVWPDDNLWIPIVGAATLAFLSPS